MNIINKIREFFAKDKKEFRNRLNEKESLKNCGCSCKCCCDNILNINAVCENTKEYGLYKYTCNDCSEVSYFHYAIAPAPIKFKEEEIKGLIC
jgi:hypothetical protein